MTSETRLPRGLRTWLAPPTDPFTALRLRIARRVEVAGLLALAALCALLPFRDDVTVVDWVAYPTLGLMLTSMLVLRSRFPGAAGLIGGVGIVAVVTTGAWFREGLASGSSSGAYALAVVVAGLLWGPGKTMLVATVASVGAALLAWYAPRPSPTPLRSWAEVTATLFTLALFVELTLSALASKVAEAQSSHQRFQQLFDVSPDGLVLVDQATRIQLINPAARQMLGLHDVPSSATLLTHLPAFQGDAAKLVRPLTQQHAQTDGSSADTISFTPENCVSFVEGRFHEVALTPLSNPAEASSNHWLLTIRDVSERLAATKARHQFEAQLAQSKSLEALGRLAGGVAHDFNNLLTVILGTTDLVLSRDDLDPGLREDVGSIQSSAERAAELTSQLLAFGRKQVLEPAVFCPNDSLSRLQSLFERLVPSHVKLHVNRDPALGDARLDPARLEQVLVNLVTNAADAMPNGGQLAISTENKRWREAEAEAGWVHQAEPPPAGAYVAVTVSDTGSGMDGPTQARIFDPFFTTKALGKGTGLGLATVLGIVRQSGGYIRLQSTPGEGTRFQLLFPRVEPQERLVPPVPSSRKRQSLVDDPTKGMRILLVEDDSAVRESVLSMLVSSGHHVTCAVDGKDALSRFAECATQFDLLLTDVVMPQLNGRQLASALHRVAPELPVLFMTGYTDDAIVQEGGELGEGLHYLPKPFTRRTLDRKLAELCALRVAIPQSEPPA